ncbi:MAG TPA: saccharopine dehydrogenase C-terminal domain-containing protein [Allosphingosinicella sp.]|nr:saccharopine dehydrogenase C-terminal domain-containing protein [Allosphingosinicella sp.]
MNDVLLVGGGKIGAMITELLAGCGDYRVTVADRSAAALANVAVRENVDSLQLDVTDGAALGRALEGRFAVLSAVPFSVTRHVADGAAAASVHYFDLTEDVRTTNHVKTLAESARSVLMPQCGLAPGFISVAAHDLAGRFDKLDEIRMRVGALTENPANRLRYELTWSVEGLVHEYLAECDAVVDGKPSKVRPLEGHETFTLDGIDYEAFNTSGGVGTLGATLAGRVRNLNYKTIRYPGHCAIMKRLIGDLGLDEATLTEILGYALPRTSQDIVLIVVSATGRIGGEARDETFVRKVYSRAEGGAHWSAIQITTASAICAALDLVREGRLPQQGFVRQEDISLEDFIVNRFGRNYA